MNTPNPTTTYQISDASTSAAVISVTSARGVNGIHIEISVTVDDSRSASPEPATVTNSIPTFSGWRGYLVDWETVCREVLEEEIAVY